MQQQEQKQISKKKTFMIIFCPRSLRHIVDLLPFEALLKCPLEQDLTAAENAILKKIKIKKCWKCDFF